jgi:hypothetical protein
MHTLRKVTLARGAPIDKFVSPSPEFPVHKLATHHDRNRGQSPLRHPGCIHYAQPVPISPLSQC